MKRKGKKLFILLVVVVSLLGMMPLLFVKDYLTMDIRGEPITRLTTHELVLPTSLSSYSSPSQYTDSSPPTQSFIIIGAMNTMGTSLASYIKGHTHHRVVCMEDSIVIDKQESKWDRVTILNKINVSVVFVDFTKDLQKYFDTGLSLLNEMKIKRRKETQNKKRESTQEQDIDWNQNEIAKGMKHLIEKDKEKRQKTDKNNKDGLSVQDTEENETHKLNIIFIPTCLFTKRNKDNTKNIEIITSQLDALHKLLYFIKDQASFNTSSLSLFLPMKRHEGQEMERRLWRNMFERLFKGHTTNEANSLCNFKLVHVIDGPSYGDNNNDDNTKSYFSPLSSCNCLEHILNTLQNGKVLKKEKLDKKYSKYQENYQNVNDKVIPKDIEKEIVLNYTCYHLLQTHNFSPLSPALTKKNITVGHYLTFTSHYRWGRAAPLNSISYIADWVLTANKYTPNNSNIVIFHDHLTSDFQTRLSTYYPKVQFERVHSLNRRILHDQRLYMTYNYLLRHPEVEYIVITDIRDTIFMSDPFIRMAAIGRNYFFIDSDSPYRFSVSDLPWLEQMTRLCYSSNTTSISDEAMYMYGCYDNGFMGGTRSVMLSALIRILMILDYADLGSVCDQVSANMMAHEYMYESVYSGYPLSGSFMTGLAGPRGVAIKHKPYEYIDEKNN